MTTAVVAGTVTVVQFARVGDLPWELATPLLLLGAVAVPAVGAELAAVRRDEVGLARLRGIHGLRLWRLVMAEPLLAISLGLVLGLALGAGLTVVTIDRWLGEVAPALEWRTTAMAAAIALGGLVIVALGAARALREPLATQVAVRRRPRPATTLAAFASVLVMVAAGVAVYRSRAAEVSGNGDPDLVVLLGPALIGLALGQVTIWVVRALARGGVGASRTRGLAPFLASRRLARGDDLVTPLRLVVAAAVIGTLALTGSSAVGDWTDDAARVAAPGARVVDADMTALQALALTRRLDPDGEHLMAAGLVPSETRIAERRAYVDAARWESVVRDAYDDTPAAAASRAVPRLVPATPPAELAVADTFTVSGTAVDKVPAGTPVRNGGPETRASAAMEVGVEYVTATGGAGSASVVLRLPDQGDSDEVSVPVEDCDQGCLVTSLVVTRIIEDRGTWIVWEDSRFVVALDRVQLGDLDLTQQVWLPDESVVEALDSRPWNPPVPRDVSWVVNGPDALQVAALPDGPLPLLPEAAEAPVAVLAADGEDVAPLDLGGGKRAGDVVGRAAVVPLVGTRGELMDLPTSAVGSSSSVPSMLVKVIVGADAPAELVTRLEEETGASAVAFDDVRRALDRSAGGTLSRAYAMTALACALVALIALAAGVARHLREYRRDVAALRVVGIPLATARRAGSVELAGLTVLVAVAVAAGGWLAVELLLDGLPLVSAPVAAPDVDTAAHAWPLLIAALVAAVAVLVVGGRARAVRNLATRPAQLREEEG
jgi:hypothetical protein